MAGPMDQWRVGSKVKSFMEPMRIEKTMTKIANTCVVRLLYHVLRVCLFRLVFGRLFKQQGGNVSCFAYFFFFSSFLWGALQSEGIFWLRIVCFMQLGRSVSLALSE